MPWTRLSFPTSVSHQAPAARAWGCYGNFGGTYFLSDGYGTESGPELRLAAWTAGGLQGCLQVLGRPQAISLCHLPYPSGRWMELRLSTPLGTLDVHGGPSLPARGNWGRLGHLHQTHLELKFLASTSSFSPLWCPLDTLGNKGLACSIWHQLFPSCRTLKLLKTCFLCL